MRKPKNKNNITPEIPKHRSKKKRIVKVIGKFTGDRTKETFTDPIYDFLYEDRVYKKYSSVKAAKNAIDDLNRKGSYGLRTQKDWEYTIVE